MTKLDKRRRYCEIHDCTYGWGCPQCRDEAAASDDANREMDLPEGEDWGDK